MGGRQDPVSVPGERERSDWSRARPAWPRRHLHHPSHSVPPDRGPTSSSTSSSASEPDQAEGAVGGSGEDKEGENLSDPPGPVLSGAVHDGRDPRASSNSGTVHVLHTSRTIIVNHFNLILFISPIKVADDIIYISC